MFNPITLWEKDGSLKVHDGRRRIKALRVLSNKWEKRVHSHEGVEEATNPYEFVEAKIVSTDGFENHELLTIILNTTAKPNLVTEVEAIEGVIRRNKEKGVIITPELCRYPNQPWSSSARLIWLSAPE